MKYIKGNKGITLVALVVTIVVLLILAGITINFILGQNSIFDLAREAGEKSKEQKAKERLEIALADLKIKKHVDSAYDQDGYINEQLASKGITLISGDIFLVDDYQFQIDRSIPAITASLGEGKLNDKMEIELSQELGEKCVSSLITIVITNENEIKVINVAGQEITDIEKEGNKYTAAVNIEHNGEYNILAKDEEGSYNINSIVVNEIADDMDINNMEDWKRFNTIAQKGGIFEGKKVNLQTDLNLAEENHTPIPDFKGTFEGNNHTIENLTINKTAQYTGLFAVVHNATIQNLILTDVNVNGGTKVGSLVGTVWGGNINNITIDGLVNCTGEHIGGVIGDVLTANIPTNISNVKANVNVSTNNTTATDSCIGGFIGFISSTGVNISDSSATGTVKSTGAGTTNVTGGFIGYLGEQEVATYLEPTRIKRCFCKATVQGHNLTGGFIAWGCAQFECNASYYADIEDCYFIGSVSGTTTVGGFIGGTMEDSGHALNISFRNCFCSALVTGTDSWTNGAFYGYTVSGTGITFSECYFDKAVSGITRNVGTAIGKTTTEMQTPSTFSNWSADIWKLEEGKYPELTSVQ